MGHGSGLSVSFSFDGAPCWAPAALLKPGQAGRDFMVTYADSWLNTDLPLGGKFAQAGKKALMTVFRNADAWDSSNVEFDGARIVAYSKREKTPRMQFIDWGLGMIGPGAFAGWEEMECFDLATFMVAGEEGELTGYEVKKRSYVKAR